MLMLPEIVVLVTALAVLLVDLLLSEARRTVLAPLAMTGLALAFVATLLTPQVGEMFGGRFAMDAVAWWFKLVFLFAGFVCVILSRDLLDGHAKVPVPGLSFRGEYYTLLLSTTVGMMYLISARDLVTLYVSLELATVPLFVLAAWQRSNARSGEAGLKYLIVGALASAFILYGLALLYGLTGQTDLVAISRLLQPSAVLWLAAGLITTGVGFKLTLVPFHMWAADVYQGAPTPVTAYLSVASKAAGLAFMFQLFFRVVSHDLQHWAMALALMAAVTMTLGNVVAIWQQNIKRFMAFSAISQAGYLIMGFLGPAAEGVPAMLFYLVVYAVTNLAVFACIIWYANETGREEINDYRGLSRTNPLMALALMIGLFSLAGIPPLSGFVGKFFLFSIASKANFHWLVALAAVNSTISLYYYLRIVRQMYIEPPMEGATCVPSRRLLALTIGVLTTAAVLIGVIPGIYEEISVQTLGWLAPLVRP